MDNVNVDVSDDVVVDEYEDMLPAEEEFSAAYPVDSDAAERLRGLIVYLATNLVDDPNTVEVEARQRGGSVFVSLRVPEEELGKVIGRGGRVGTRLTGHRRAPCHRGRTRPQTRSTGRRGRG